MDGDKEHEGKLLTLVAEQIDVSELALHIVKICGVHIGEGAQELDLRILLM